LILAVSGCQQKLPEPKKPIIDQTLPKVANIRSISDMTEIAFEWEPLYNERVQGYYIYRSDPLSKDSKMKRVAKIEDRYSSHYVDIKLIPNTMYYYRFASYSKDLRESVASELYSAKTLPLLESVAFLKAIVGLPGKVKLIWRPHPSPRVCEYLIERNELSSDKWLQVAVVKGRLNAEYIDSKLKNNHVYRYRIKVKTCDGLISNPSEIVEAKTKPLPATVSNVEATTYLPKRIKITWSANPEKDISYYNIYRAVNPLLFYTYHAKTKETSFEDMIGEDGVARYYKITAVDSDGLESLKQENPIMGSTLGKPATPIVTQAAVNGDKAVIKWSNADNRAKRYVVIKKYKDGWKTKEMEYANIQVQSFVDRDIIPGIKYKYSIIAVDEFSISSKPSEDVVLYIPKK